MASVPSQRRIPRFLEVERDELRRLLILEYRKWPRYHNAGRMDLAPLWRARPPRSLPSPFKDGPEGVFQALHADTWEGIKDDLQLADYVEAVRAKCRSLGLKWQGEAAEWAAAWLHNDFGSGVIEQGPYPEHDFVADLRVEVSLSNGSVELYVADKLSPPRFKTFTKPGNYCFDDIDAVEDAAHELIEWWFDGVRAQFKEIRHANQARLDNERETYLPALAAWLMRPSHRPHDRALREKLRRMAGVIEVDLPRV